MVKNHIQKVGLESVVISVDVMVKDFLSLKTWFILYMFNQTFFLNKPI